MSKNCNRVSNYSTRTVFVEKCGMCVRYVSRIRFSKGLDSIDYLFLTDCKKHKKLRKMRCMPAIELSRSVGVVKSRACFTIALSLFTIIAVFTLNLLKMKS